MSSSSEAIKGLAGGTFHPRQTVSTRIVNPSAVAPTKRVHVSRPVGSSATNMTLVAPLGQGTRFYGLPSDTNPASRFVRGAAFVATRVPVDTEESLSISAWVAHTDQFVDVPMVVSVTSDPLSGEQDVSIGIGIGGSVWIFGQGAGPMVDGPKAAIADEWVHLVGVSDREAGELRLYVNGSLVGTARATTAPLAAGGPVIVGGGLDANWWAGAITDVAIYQQALTDDQVSKLHQGSRPESEPPLWHPDPSTYADGALDGTWDYDLSVAADGAILAQLESDLGRSLEGASIRLGFDGPKWWQGFAVNGELTPIGPDPVGDVGTVTIDGDRLTVTAWAWVATYRWDLAADRLELELMEQCERQTDQCFTGADIDEVDPFVRAITQHTFTKSGTDPTY